MTNVCSICVHPSRLEIDIALLRGEPYPVIAERYEVSPQALGRHKRGGHILERLKVANKLLDREEALDLVREARRILGELQSIVYLAEARHSYRTSIEGLRAQLEVLKTLGLENQTAQSAVWTGKQSQPARLQRARCALREVMESLFVD